jgi:pimeloyl-ACP methyl ester carboxylesterase
MSTTPATSRPITTRTIAAPGATITYDIHGDLADATPGRPPLLLIGSPMDASGFTTLASHFPDRVLVTYDPRGAGRSTKDDPTTETTPAEHADDLHRVVTDLGVAPVDVFASSGGAVNALVLVATHPQDVRTLVAHEPPAASALPDREHAFAAVRVIERAYAAGGWGAGMAAFIAITSHQGEFTGDIADQGVPDPAVFGLPTGDDGARDDVMLHQNLVPCTHHEHDVAALRAAPTRIVIAVGEESGGEMAARSGRALAAQLGLEPVVFPGGHGGFLGGEFGQTGKPTEFAAALRAAL